MQKFPLFFSEKWQNGHPVTRIEVLGTYLNTRVVPCNL